MQFLVVLKLSRFHVGNNELNIDVMNYQKIYDNIIEKAPNGFLEIANMRKKDLQYIKLRVVNPFLYLVAVMNYRNILKNVKIGEI